MNGGMQFGINMSEDSRSFTCFQSDAEFIPDPRRSDRGSTFDQLKFSFRHNKLF